MSERLEGRLRTAAQTERALGNYELEQMLLDAADTITELRKDLEFANNEWEKDSIEFLNLQAENAKLRKLCKTLYQLADESYVPFGSTNRWMDDFAKAICAMRELGIEVGE